MVAPSRQGLSSQFPEGSIPLITTFKVGPLLTEGHPLQAHIVSFGNTHCVLLVELLFVGLTHGCVLLLKLHICFQVLEKSVFNC